MIARKRYEANGQELAGRDPAVIALGYQDKLLGGKSRSDRQDHPPARFQLLEQRWRDVRCDRGHDDRVKGRVLLPAVVAIAQSHFDVAVPEPGETLARCDPEGLDYLDRVDLFADMAEDRRLVSRARTDLERP